MKKYKRYFYIPIIALFALIAFNATARENAKGAGYARVKEYVMSEKPSREVLSPEGEFVTVFNDRAAEWIKSKIDKRLLKEIREALKDSLYIKLNERGFAPAASRGTGGEKDETHYDAIWVRDNVWVYYSFLADPARRGDARRLLLALWDYYATERQVKRFLNIIADPSLSRDEMAMPHIRFDGNSPSMGDVMIDGKPEHWNHRQIDAHGIFFTALAEAVTEGIIRSGDLTESRFRVLCLYPRFLEAIKFYDYEDAGAWEEITRKNTSSIALATRSLEAWQGLLYENPDEASHIFRKKFFTDLKKQDNDIFRSWDRQRLGRLTDKGLNTVKYQLSLGGESPDYSPYDVHFRLADAALIFLIQPSPLRGITEKEMRKALLIVKTLKRPAGVLRYVNDSYQSGNFWIKASDKAASGLTADTSSKDAFIARLSGLIPDTEAEWFFDSLIALAHLHLAQITEDPNLRREDLYLATVHLKRSLGQITGDTIAADGSPVRPLLPPESVNTVVIDGQKYYLPSPIVPLNWAKAALEMALSAYEKLPDEL